MIMYYLPSLFGEDLFEDWNTCFPRVRDFEDVDKKLYGKHASQLMKTDVHENETGYEVDIDLPGFKKDEITLTLHQGNLMVRAAKGLDKEEKDKRGKLIRQERYAGSMQRSFYVGEAVEEEDIKARFEDGVLRLVIPKKEAKKVEEKKTIMIEG